MIYRYLKFQANFKYNYIFFNLLKVPPNLLLRQLLDLSQIASYNLKSEKLMLKN